MECWGLTDERPQARGKMLQLLPRVEEGFASLISCSTREKAGYFQRDPTWEASKEGEEDTVNSIASRGHPSLSLSPSRTLRAPCRQKPYHNPAFLWELSERQRSSLPTSPHELWFICRYPPHAKHCLHLCLYQ